MNTDQVIKWFELFTSSIVALDGGSFYRYNLKVFVRSAGYSGQISSQKLV